MPHQPHPHFHPGFNFLDKSPEQLASFQGEFLEHPSQALIPGYSKQAIEAKHQDWIQDYQQAHRENQFEKAWNQRPPQPWAQQFEHQQHQEFEQVFKNAETTSRAQTWAEKFAEEEERNARSDSELKEIGQKVATIPDAKLQDLKPGPDGQLNEVAGSKFANEFLSQQPKSTWADQYHNQQSWAEQFHGQTPSWAEQFEGPDDWAEQFNSFNWADLFNNNWDESLLEEYEKVFNAQNPGAQPISEETYTFQQNNPFLGDKEALAKGIHLFDEGKLSESILAFEAAVQQDPTNSESWTKLGIAQAENDKDRLAIQALEQAVAVDHGNLPALMALAVSQTNEYNKAEAAAALLQWLIENPKYKDLATRAGQPRPGEDATKFVAGVYLEAARQSSTVDPDVHTALGLFFNLSYEYSKAVECFRAALTVRPEDYALWNKLGATMANDITTRGKNTDLAIDSYFRALERKPSYTRARSNLGISYMSAHNYVESAKCFLGALSINNSDHLWSSLKTSLQLMHRPDLVQKCSYHDVSLFTADFDF